MIMIMNIDNDYDFYVEWKKQKETSPREKQRKKSFFFDARGWKNEKLKMKDENLDWEIGRW